MDIPTWLHDEAVLRLSFFLGIFLSVAVLERCFPRRAPAPGRGARWLGNLSLVLIDSVCARLLFLLLGSGTVALAWLVEQWGWGLLQQWDMPWPWTVLLGVLLMDLVIYWQHRLFHAVPLLWRLHRVHHADHDLDVSSALRFHPLEILLSLLIKMSCIVLFGVPALAILVFEVLLNGMAMFNHANLHIPTSLDRILRWLLVTPDVHRIHHSIHAEELNSNYGFNILWWDRLFGSYRAHPRDGQRRMRIGLATWQQAPTWRLSWMLSCPWK